HTVDILGDIPEIEHVLVVSRDQAALSLARAHGARTVQEKGAPELNVALTRATIVAKRYATRGVLIIPSDLPMISKEDVYAMLEKVKDPPVVVVAPDRKKKGTNALLICPVGLIEYDYGPNSFERHCQHAQEVGARLEICELPSLALDMDVPEDLELVSNELESWTV
ncbi:MAG: 2-phospho-L-lactate guanylyltransferase, partial [Anaerolineales bacterium]|nr:2-phospho-L-lactate guanylyltransferase [Anaerolineales bacterium]